MALTLAACDKKPETAAAAAPAPVVESTSKTPSAAQPKAAEKKAENAKPVVTESTQTAAAKPQAVEDGIEEVNKYGRAVTKTQESKTRTRAQLAEEEMQRDLQNFK